VAESRTNRRIRHVTAAAAKDLAVFSSKVGVANLEQYWSRRTVAIFVFIW